MAKKKDKKKPRRKRQEIKKEQIRKRAIIKKLKYLTALVILVIIVLSAAILYQSYTNEDSNGDNNTNGDNNGVEIGINVGQIAPNFELTDTDYNKFNLEDLRGGVVILDFMATWCAPCDQELEQLKDIRSNYDDSSVKIVSIDVDNSETSNHLKNYKYNNSCDWIFAAYGGSVADTYAVEGIPTLYLIDKQGKITYTNVGLTDSSILQSEIEKLI